MRLSLDEIEAIVFLKEKIFGKKPKIYLFGSRVDDDKKGGDIDLYIEGCSENSRSENKLLFLSLLKEKLGSQKIDVVLERDRSRPIEIEAIKGVELDIEKIKLQKYFNECDKHIQRIDESYSDIESILPITAKKYKELSRDNVQAIDQYLFRFAKLQDTLGDKIFKSIVKEYIQSDESMPFKDILNMLEKSAYLESAKEWMYLREVRNVISHQYDDEPEEMSHALNSVLMQKDILKGIYLRVKERYKLST